MYKEYKGTRHAMPQELAEQMPVIKEVLKAMNIAISKHLMPDIMLLFFLEIEITFNLQVIKLQFVFLVLKWARPRQRIMMILR